MRIIDMIGKPAMYDMLAEECVELAHAAIKMSRILRSENPTPRTEEDVYKDIIEEVTDVRLCLDDMELYSDIDLKNKKEQRFWKRWKERGIDGTT